MATPTSLSAPLSLSCLFSTSVNQIHLKSVSNLIFSSIKSSSFHCSNLINIRPLTKPNTLICNSSSTVSPTTTSYEFSDGSDEVELRLLFGDESIQSSKDVLVDADESFLTIKMKQNGSFRTAMEINLYDKIKPAETIWYPLIVYKSSIKAV